MGKNKEQNNGNFKQAGNIQPGGNMQNAEMTNPRDATNKTQNNTGNNKKNQGAQNTK